MYVGLWWLALLLLASAKPTASQGGGPRGTCSNSASVNATCGAQCQQETSTALQGIYRLTRGPQWAKQPEGWNDAQLQCKVPGTGEVIPDFCCYEYISCCCLEFCSKCDTCGAKYAVQGLFIKDMGLQGRLADLMPYLATLHKWGLQDLSLEGNKLTGPLPPEIGSLVNMSRISLGSNRLTGTLPNTLYNLTKLASLGLDQNQLNGTIPDTLCGLNNSLTDLYLRGNYLVGDVNLVNCTMLINLDLQDNALTGDIPASNNWKQMHVLRISNNKFQRIPETFYRMERMVILDANNNNISGTLSSNISQLEGLTNVYLESNKLTGTVPREVFQLKRLSFLYLDFNQMSGTVPDNIGDCSGTITVNLRNNNNITGYIPASTAQLRFPVIMDFVGTYMHGCNASGDFEGHKDCLPAFLQYDKTKMIPPVQSIPVRGGDVILGTNSPMKCPTIITRPNASLLPEATQWLITETYYNYKFCSCDTGYVPTYQQTLDGFTIMNCTLADTSSTALLVGVLVPVLVCVWALLLFGFSIFMKKGGWFGLKRYKERAVRRMTGMKREGEVSIVVTDIENYSELLKALGPEMMEALRLHNDTLRKAKWDNCGSTVEQEGDSFSIVFHDAMDAVAFCLQAQQKLMKVEWPAGLGRDASLITKRTSGSRLLANMRMLVGRTAHSIINRRGNSTQLPGGSSQSLQAPALEAMSSTGPGGFLRLGTTSRGWRPGSGASFHQQLPPGGQGQQGQGNVALNASAPVPLASLNEGSPSEQQQWSGRQQQQQQQQLPLTVSGRQFSFPSYMGHSAQVSAVRQGSGSMLARGSVEPGMPASSGAATATGGAAQGTSSPVPPPLLRSVSPMITSSDSPRYSFTEGQQQGSAQGPAASAAPDKLRTHSDRSQASSSGIGSQGELPLAHSYQSAPMSAGFSGTGGRHCMGAALTQPSADDPLLFNGLRVRMGVATGVLERGQDVKNTAVWELAKVVSDAASGGQVLMESTTFNAIKERLAELGAVDENGMNFKRLSWKAKAGWFSWLGALNRTLTRNVQQRAEEAVILDMGQYSSAAPLPIAKKMPAAAAPAATPASASSGVIKAQMPARRINSSHNFVTRDQGSGPRDQAAALAAERALERTAAARAAAAAKESEEMPSTWNNGDNAPGGNVGSPGSSTLQPMHLFQILPQPLAGRARVFGNKLVLAEDITCIDPPYFAAPGTLQAQLVSRQPKNRAMSLGRSTNSGMLGVPSEDGTSVTYSMRPLLPPVTMVFTKVDLDRPLLKRSRDGRACHQLLSNCMRAMLALVPGGYFCREQEGDLKYMTVFSTPQAAMEWCLLVQQAAMYLPWPETLLSLRQFRVEEDSQQRLAFRGPRLKMGVCEGTPNSIQPDHLGRADYHGESINLAARFMDAAAHGGQVVCELDLAQSVFDGWRLKHSGGSYDPFGRVVSAPGTFKPVRRAMSDGFGSILQPLMSPPSLTEHPTIAEIPQQQQPQQQQQVEQQRAAQGQQRVSFDELAIQSDSAAVLRSHAIIGPELDNSSPEPSPARAVEVLPISEDSVQPVTAADISAAQQLTAPLSQPLPGGAFSSPFAAAISDVNGSSGTLTHVSAGSQQQSGQSVSADAVARLAASDAAGEPATLEPSTAPAPAGAPAAADAAAEGASAAAGRPDASAAAPTQTRPATLPPAALQPPSSSTLGSDTPVVVPTIAATAPSPTPQPLPAGEWQLCVQEVIIHRLGSFNFKGNQQAKPMVFVTLQALAGRSFPEDPPRGKGMRVQVASGEVDRVEVVLPDVVHHYKAKLPLGTTLRESAPVPRAAVRSVSTSLAGLASDRRVASTSAAQAAVSPWSARDVPDAEPSRATRLHPQGLRTADDQV